MSRISDGRASGRGLFFRFEEAAELADGPAAVADLVLDRRRELGEGLSQRGVIEDRVVAEAGDPARPRGDPAPDLAPELGDDAAPLGEDHDADEAGLPRLRRKPGQEAQDLADVLLVRRPRGGEAGRSDPGRPPERFDLEARVLGQGQAGPSPAVEKALGPGVLLERAAALGVFQPGQDARETDDLEGPAAGGEALQGAPDLADLAGVSGRQEEATLSQSSALRCRPARGDPG